MKTYRPQFVRPMVTGEEDFVYSFSQFNVPALAGNITLQPGQTLNDVVLQLQADAPFILRGVLITTYYAFGFQLRTSEGKLMDDVALDLHLTYQGSNALSPYYSMGSTPVVVEPELPCQSGGLLLLDVTNFYPVALQVASINILLMGVKRFGGDYARAR